ncbi:hypothetical protein E2R55_03200 [Vibrio vulnificus]|nr:hypothetical protein E2R55_03200 [Vibrio vulnificus]
MADMITLTHANSKKQLSRKLDQIKSSHIGSNPNQEVLVEVLNPNPDEVTFNEHHATQFTVRVTIKDYEDD